MFKANDMTIEGIASFDKYVWVAVGLFVLGLFATIVYERSSSNSRQYQNPSRRSPDAKK
jgi:heme exporter protein D